MNTCFQMMNYVIRYGIILNVASVEQIEIVLEGGVA